MAVTSARNIVNMKEKSHFEHNNENNRIPKYTLADELPQRLSLLQLRTMRSGYSVRKLFADDKGPVLSFLTRFFFHDEPMNKAVKLLETPESRCEELEDYALSSLDDGVSAAVVADNGEIISLVISGLVKRKDVDYTDKSEACKNEKFARILKVLAHLDREAKIWDKLPASCDSVMEMRIAATHTDWRGRGLLRVLVEESERIAKAAGAGATRVDATSAFTAAAAERLGYKNIYSICYKDLPDAPQPEAPHLEARVYIKEL